LSELAGWYLNGKWITKEFAFKNFVAAMQFVNKVAEIAEGEGHHPDIHIHYNRVRFDIWTHAIDGLSENDFILAAKIDGI
jgi:4a-hydroxytetrahydrobiopterin dehydratase